jgi:hypothetical protein
MFGIFKLLAIEGYPLSGPILGTLVLGALAAGWLWTRHKARQTKRLFDKLMAFRSAMEEAERRAKAEGTDLSHKRYDDIIETVLKERGIPLRDAAELMNKMVAELTPESK